MSTTQGQYVQAMRNRVSTYADAFCAWSGHDGTGEVLRQYSADTLEECASVARMHADTPEYAQVVPMLTAFIAACEAASGPLRCPDCGEPITANPNGWWSHNGMPNGCWRVSDDPFDTN